MPDCCSGLCGGTFFTVLIALVLCLAGLAPPYWLKSGGDHIGLWQECKGGSCHNYQNVNDPNWMNATRALLILPVMGVIATYIMYSCFCCCDRCGRNFMITIQVTLLWACAASVIVSLIVFAHHYKSWGMTSYYSKYDWSFYVTCCSAVMFIVAGFIGLMEICCAQ